MFIGVPGSIYSQCCILSSNAGGVGEGRGGVGWGGSKPSGKDQKRAGPLWFSSLDCSRHNPSSPDMLLPHLKVFVC